ncbi:Uncharacterised protein [Mobiluncus mulieris]|nr:Uncharacterised protein [Mobiluncus mulieris]
MRGGGFSEHFFQGSPVADFDSAEQGGGFDSRCFAIDADYRINETLTNGYDVQFSRGTGDTALVRERLFFHNQAKYTTPFCDDFQGNHGWLPLAHRSVLSDADDCGSGLGYRRIFDVFSRVVGFFILMILPLDRPCYRVVMLPII